MAVSMLTGHCWRQLTRQVPGFASVSDTQLLMLGTHDVDPLERDLLNASSIRVAASTRQAGADVDAIVQALRIVRAARQRD
jgi:hypothetical protein